MAECFTDYFMCSAQIPPDKKFRMIGYANHAAKS